MNLELSLLELNDLYVATSKYATKCADQLKEYGGNVSSITYFKMELRKAEALRDKIQKALYDECEALDAARDYVMAHIDEVLEDDAEQYDIEREQLKSRKLFTLNKNR